MRSISLSVILNSRTHTHSSLTFQHINRLINLDRALLYLYLSNKVDLEIKKALTGIEAFHYQICVELLVFAVCLTLY